MSKRVEGTLPGGALALIDVILINVGFVLAWFTRYYLQLGREVAAENFLPLSSYFGLQAFLTAILLSVFWLNGSYGRRRRQGLVDEITGIGSGALVGVALIIVGAFYLRPFSYSRLIFIYEWIAITAIIAIDRSVERLWLAYRRRKGHGLRRILVVGEGPLSRMIMQNVVAQPEAGYLIVGFVDDDFRQPIGRFPHLGTCDDVARIVEETRVDEVFIALPSASHIKITKILIACAQENVSFRIVPDFYELSLNQVDITEINGIPLIGLREASLKGSQRIFKRAIDLILAIFALVVLSPFLAIVAIAVKLDSPGPILITQERIGRHGKAFGFFKFRSMRQSAAAELANLLPKNEADGPIFKIKNDPRRTRTGQWLRRFSIDELPQLLNVLKGEMSLVGPRPPFPHEVEKYEDWHRKRLELAPGLTGLWQVSGRSDLPFDEMALLDIWYIENWSLSLDAKIMIRTIPAVITGRGAY